MTCLVEYEQPKFAIKRKGAPTFEVDGQEVQVSPFGYLDLGGSERVTFKGDLSEARVSDILNSYEQGKREGRRLGEMWVKRDIKSFLDIE